MWCGAVLTAFCDIKTVTRTAACGLTKFRTAIAPQQLKPLLLLNLHFTSYELVL